MLHPNSNLLPTKMFSRALPWLILAVGLSLTWLTVKTLEQQENSFSQAKFSRHVAQIATGLDERIIGNIQLLHGVAGLFAASEQVTDDEFQRYCERLRLAEYHPGLRHIAYIQLFPGSQPPYASSIHFVAPPISPAREATFLGQDLMIDPVRAKAALSSSDHAHATITDKIQLLQDEGPAEIGVGIFTPLYRPGAPMDSLAQRRAALYGWIYSALQPGSLVEHYLRREHAGLADKLSIRLYSGDIIDSRQLLYDSHPTAGETRTAEITQGLNVNGTGASWTLAIAPLPAYWEMERIETKSLGMLVAGISITVALALVSQVLLKSRHRVITALEETLEVNRQLAAEKERSYHLATHDHLTDLPNRTLFRERASQALELAERYQRQFAIFFIDLDRFKPINDAYGHEAGDCVLRIVAHRLQSQVRHSDTVCRQGGDEFVILLPEFNHRPSLQDLAKNLLQLIETPCPVHGHLLQVSASIGIATYPENGSTLDAVLQSADQAMYHAKNTPESNIQFAPPTAVQEPAP